MNHTLFPEPIGMDGYQTLLGACSDSEQLRVSHGILIRKYTVANISTVGPSLQFILTHNSVENTLGTVGRNWSHSGMHRLDFAGTPVNLVTYTDDQGRKYDFEPDGSGGWKLESTSYFLRMTLSEVSSNWELAEFGQGSKLVFDSSGVLQSIVDNHSQALTFHYTSGQLTSIEEPTGREIVLTYTGGLITKVTDPRGLETTLVFDGDSNLTSIVAPEGCELSYGYAPSSTNGLILSRTDPNNNTYVYTYDGNGRLLTVTNPDSKVLTYSYHTVYERTATPDIGTTHAFKNTILVDADGATWDYRFDDFGNLWRILDPLGHSKRLFWSDQQTLLYVSEGYAYNPGDYYGPRDNPYNRHTRFVYDSLGNRTAVIGSTGVVSQTEYDLDSRPITSTPARATLAVGGEWFEHFGKDGFLMCSALDTSADLWQKPAYVDVAGILSGETDTSNGFDRVLPELPNHLQDPRAPWIRMPGSPTRNTYRRTLGQWRNQDENESFTFRIPMSETKEFNLSIYTHCADQTYSKEPNDNTWERVYAGNFGRDIEILVSDFDPVSGDPRRQKFRMHNTAAGVWFTFGVYAEAESEIRVVVRSREVDESVYPVINCIAFDPIENRRTVMTYTGSDLTAVTNPLYQTTLMDYNGDGTLRKITDAKNRETNFYYTDVNKNLTQVVDALLGETNLIYDQNGNVTSSEDPDTRVTLMEYDGKNRLTKVTDPLGHETLFEFDPAGNLVKITDALLRETVMEYNSLNRLELIRDALNHETSLEYDFTGRLISVTDPLLRVTSFTLDAAGRRVQTDLPDGQKVLYALNSINRVVSMTGPNAARDELTNIDLTGALNVLDNPSMELEAISDNTSGAPERWTWWGYLGGGVGNISYGNNRPRSNAEAHSGTYSVSATTGEVGELTGWYQQDVPVYAGGRYLGGAWAKKAASGASDVTVALASVVRDFEAVGQTQVEPGTAIGNSWTELPPHLVEVPGDTQATRAKTPLARYEMRARKTSPGDAGTTVYFDDASLHLLSTCLEYDGENLREIATPDGARVRRDFDRVGRLCKVTDPQGRAISLQYDGLDRIVKITDSLENSLQYGFDEVGNLVSFTDAKSQVMAFDYDDLNRLITITYPDTTTEEFDYSAAGDLVSYIDNNLQTRAFGYDLGHRLILVTYPNMETVELGYDDVNNLTQRIERNGDVEVLTYDDLNRLTRRQFTPGGSSPSLDWDLTNEFDEVGNRTALRPTPSSPAVYGTGLFGTALYGLDQPDQYWEVPSGGFDEMNRMVEFHDSQDNSTEFSYDADGRRVGTLRPNGVETVARYDIVGKLLGLETSLSSTELLNLRYGYNLAGDRLSLQTEKGSYTYHLDRGGRLVQETINRWVTQHGEHLAQGELSACMLDLENQRVQLIGVADDFSVLNLDRWSTRFKELNYTPGGTPVLVTSHSVGAEIRADEGLHLNFPSAWTVHVYQSAEQVYDQVGYVFAQVLQELELRRLLTGDFDVALEWEVPDLPTPASGQQLRYPNSTALDLSVLLPDNSSRCYVQQAFSRYSGNSYRWLYSGSSQQSSATSDTTGKFRIKRAGSALNMYVWDAGMSSWTSLSGAITSGYTTNDLRLRVTAFCEYGQFQYRLVDLTNLNGKPDFPLSANVVGRYTSSLYDAGQEVEWSRIAWEETLPSNTDVKFQLAFSNSVDGPWSFIGPDGTSGTYFTTPAGEALASTSDFEGKYARFQATLSSSDGVDTPSFGNVHLSFGGSGLLASSVRNFAYDEAGNITSITTVTDSGSELDDRNPVANPINDLNQVIQQDVGGDSWVYSWDDNGNLIGKTDGTDSWTYSWNDDENRLVRVQGPGGVDVSYTYDQMGRMLTRDDGQLTQFIFDGWDCVREVRDGVDLIYHIPDGLLQSFSLNGEVYQVSIDALASVRMITDDTGAVVARMEHSAYGETIFVSAIPELENFPYSWVGSLGVRFDSATGLHYMRERWYDSTVQRFISRDPIRLEGGANLYAYADNRPTTLIDPSGTNTGNPAMQPGLQINLSSVQAALAGLAGLLNAAGAATMEVAPPVAIGLGMANTNPNYGDSMGGDRFSKRWDRNNDDAGGFQKNPPKNRSNDKARGSRRTLHICSARVYCDRHECGQNKGTVLVYGVAASFKSRAKALEHAREAAELNCKLSDEGRINHGTGHRHGVEENCIEINVPPGFDHPLIWD